MLIQNRMEALIRDFPLQLRQALDIAAAARLKPARPVRHVLVAGMGGSGIGADLVAAFARPAVPMQSVKDYHLPSWAGEETLLIASTYSGNTEETLSVLEQALQQGCRIVAVSSGGRVAEIAAEHDFDCVIVPPGRPPRSTLGFSIVQQWNILCHYGLSTDMQESIERVANFLEFQQDAIREQAAKLAQLLLDRTPVLYSSSAWEAVLRRCVQQIQENGKMLCWMNTLPEMNHNELVGWRDRREDLAVLFFRSSLDYERTALRMDITRQLINESCDRVLEIRAEGRDLLEQSFYWIHLGDWLSVELAALRDLDPVEIAVIDRLKDELDQIP